MEYQRAFRILNLHPRRYLFRRALPLVVGGAVLAALLATAGRIFLPGWLALLLPFGVLACTFMLALMYPVSAADRKRAEIDDAMPFFMTHFGVLSTANMPRTEVLRLLSEKTEYRTLAEEVGRIHSLVTHWKMSFPEACRFVSRSTPSQIFGDFLDRMAHALETGQSLESFLASEQSVVMKEYSTVYETSIYQVETWKDLYISSVMSGAFFVIFAIITPILTGNDPQTLLIGVLAFVLFMELLLLAVLRFRVPADRLLHNLSIPVPERSLVRRSLAVTAAVGVLLFTAFHFTPLPLGLSMALAVTPVAFTGHLAHSLEDRVKRREENYGAFIRSLGASAAARGGSPREVLKQVRNQNFGPLTPLVQNLHARLSWRLDDAGAWKHFSAESGSHLVDSFTDMFTEGVNSGGKPDRIGEIINHNVVRILNLRKSRYSTAGTFRGLVLGLTASMAFVMFIGVGILGVLGDLFSGTAQSFDGQTDLMPIGLDFSADIALVSNLVMWLLLFHSFLAAVVLKMVDGGAIPAGLRLFVLMMWIAAVLALAAQWVMPSVFSVPGPG